MILSKNIVQNAAGRFAGAFAGALDDQGIRVEGTAHDDGVLGSPEVVGGVHRRHVPEADTGAETVGSFLQEGHKALAEALRSGFAGMCSPGGLVGLQFFIELADASLHHRLGYGRRHFHLRLLQPYTGLTREDEQFAEGILPAQVYAGEMDSRMGRAAPTVVS